MDAKNVYQKPFDIFKIKWRDFHEVWAELCRKYPHFVAKKPYEYWKCHILVTECQHISF